MANWFIRSFLFLLIILGAFRASSQNKLIVGKIVNPFTKEPVPFASVQWKKNGNGILSDSSGLFTIRNSAFPLDSLLVGYVGYDMAAYFINSSRSDTLILYIGQLKQSNEVFVKSKFSKGLRWWKTIVANKPKNDPFQYESYSYVLYNKLEIDLNNIKKEKFNNIKLMKPFGFVLDNIDSITENRPFIPVFLTESLSNYYYTNNPSATREFITAQQTHGLKNESMLQFLNGINQKINVYSNQLTIFGKEFISPLSSSGNKYYNYKGADTVTIGNEKFYHLIFTPLRDGENTFSGDCWIHGSSWGIQRISLNINATANINFVQRLTISQEFKKNDSGKWLFAKDIFVAEVSPLKKDKFSFIGRKTKLYNNIQINNPDIITEIKKNKTKDETISSEEILNTDKNFWNNNRPERLSTNEENVLKLIDTLKTMPVFKKYSETVEFVFGGYKKLGKFEIGPWFKWISGNQLERFRLRFDLGTTDLFSKNWRLHAYLAYGFRDNRFKGKFDVNYKIPNSKGWSLNASYLNDLDNGKIKYNDEDVTTDNSFSQLIRRPNIPQKFLGIEEYKFGFTKEWASHFSINSFISRIDNITYDPLPSNRLLSDNAIINTELVLKFRYAPGERSINTHRKDYKLKTNKPIYELRFGQSAKGLFQGEYQFSKLNASIRQRIRIPRFGQLNYMIYGGKIWSKSGLPFMLLELHPGNEIFYYNKESFNLMNRFEYFSDRFVGINIEHNIEKKLLNLFPFMRKSPIRQFWNVKTVWGNLNRDSRILNRTDFGDYRLRALNDNFYTEIGTGLDNIARFFRVDFVWRINPNQTNNPVYQNFATFAILGSFRIKF